jgi:hypothetical protein
MAEYDEIERTIVRKLDSILRTRVAASGSDRAWTIKVKRTLGELGQELGYQVCASDPRGRFEAEWLYDLIWYAYDYEDHLEKIPLILEMEWAMSEVDPVGWTVETVN